MTEREIDVATPDGPMAVVVTTPDAGPGPWPTVLVFIDAPGLRQHTRDFMARLAGHRYRVVTPDLHHRHGRLLSYEPEERAADPDVGRTIGEWIASMTDEQIQSDADHALQAADVGDNTAFMVVGFCLGARAMVRTLERFPDRALAGAGWHPSFLVDDTATSPHLTAAHIEQPMFFGVGVDDHVQPFDDHVPFFDSIGRNDTANIVRFPDTGHGYTWPGYPTYNEHAAETSWSITLQMFAQAQRAAG